MLIFGCHDDQMSFFIVDKGVDSKCQLARTYEKPASYYSQPGLTCYTASYGYGRVFKTDPNQNRRIEVSFSIFLVLPHYSAILSVVLVSKHVDVNVEQWKISSKCNNSKQVSAQVSNYNISVLLGVNLIKKETFFFRITSLVTNK